MSWTNFGWRRFLGAALACCVTALAAFAMPVRVPEHGARAPSGGPVPEALIEVEREDLGAFLEIRRWSVPSDTTPALPDRPVTPKSQPQPSVNPILVRMGYVGLISARGEHAVLLALPDGRVVRMVPGDTLPDGRILVSVTDNSLTLEAEDGDEEVLRLFPRAERDAGARDIVGEPGRQGAQSGAAPRLGAAPRVPKQGFGASQ